MIEAIMYFRNELLVLDENILVRLFMQVIFIPKAHIYHRKVHMGTMLMLKINAIHRSRPWKLHLWREV